MHMQGTAAGLVVACAEGLQRIHAIKGKEQGQSAQTQLHRTHVIAGHARVVEGDRALRMGPSWGFPEAPIKSPWEEEAVLQGGPPRSSIRT